LNDPDRAVEELGLSGDGVDRVPRARAPALGQGTRRHQAVSPARRRPPRGGTAIAARRDAAPLLGGLARSSRLPRGRAPEAVRWRGQIGSTWPAPATLFGVAASANASRRRTDRHEADPTGWCALTRLRERSAGRIPTAPAERTRAGRSLRAKPGLRGGERRERRGRRDFVVAATTRGPESVRRRRRPSGARRPADISRLPFRADARRRGARHGGARGGGRAPTTRGRARCSTNTSDPPVTSPSARSCAGRLSWCRGLRSVYNGDDFRSARSTARRTTLTELVDRSSAATTGLRRWCSRGQAFVAGWLDDWDAVTGSGKAVVRAYDLSRVRCLGGPVGRAPPSGASPWRPGDVTRRGALPTPTETPCRSCAATTQSAARCSGTTGTEGSSSRSAVGGRAEWRSRQAVREGATP
jgi:hypothetical protein